MLCQPYEFVETEYSGRPGSRLLVHLDKQIPRDKLFPNVDTIIVKEDIMNVRRMVFIFILVIATGVGSVIAAEQASVEKGKVLFNDTKLGAAGKSCSTCHKDGSGLSNAAAKAELPSIVNTCITKALQGSALKPDSVEMQSLVMYIKTFGEKKPAKKKAAVGC